MKHFGCTDIGKHYSEDEMENDFTELSAVEIPEEKIDTIDKMREKLENAKQGAKTPKWLKYMYSVACPALMLIFIAVMLLRDKSVPFEQFLSENPIFTVFGLLLGALALVTIRIFKAKQRADYDDSMINDKVRSAQKELARAYEAAGIPSRAVAVDLLTFDYSEENGKTVIDTTDDEDTPYSADEIRIYEKDGRFCLFYIPFVCSFDTSELKAIKKVDEKIKVNIFVFSEESERKVKLKQRNIVIDDEYLADIDGYFYLLVEQGGEEYAVYFPSYELEAIEKLTGMKAE